MNAIPLHWRYKQSDKKNILIFANRRGGSTLIQHVLSVDKRVRVVSEPFDIFERQSRANKIKKKLLPNVYFSQFISLGTEESRKVTAFMDNIMKGELLELGFYFRSSRTVVKIVNAHALIDLLTERFNTDTILFIRHPVAQARSIVRNNWGFTSKAFLQDDLFCNKYLSDEQYEFGHQLMDGGSSLEKAVLSWCLENLYPLHHSTCEKLILCYEELVINTPPIVEILSQRFSITNVGAMSRAVNTPASSVHRSTKQTVDYIVKQNKWKLIGQWINDIGPADLDKAQRILDIFEIDAYQAREVAPDKSVLSVAESAHLLKTLEHGANR